MKLWDKMKTGYKKGSKKVSGVTEELAEKGKEAGGEGLETVREFFSQIGEKASEVTSVVKLQYEVGSLQKSFERETLTLGSLVLEHYRAGKRNADDEQLRNQLKKMMELEQQIQSTEQKYDELRKGLSDEYVVSKVSKDLAASGAVIEQVIISEKSNVADKLLKEILLPKEALISVVKKGDTVIIPDGNTKLQAGDLVTIIGKTGDVEKVAKRLLAS